MGSDMAQASAGTSAEAATEAATGSDTGPAAGWLARKLGARRHGLRDAGALVLGLCLAAVQVLPFPAISATVMAQLLEVP